MKIIIDWENPKYKFVKTSDTVWSLVGENGMIVGIVCRMIGRNVFEVSKRIIFKPNGKCAPKYELIAEDIYGLDNAKRLLLETLVYKKNE